MTNEPASSGLLAFQTKCVACGTPQLLGPTYPSLLEKAPAVVCRPKARLCPQAEPQPVAFRGFCTSGPALAHQTLPSSQTEQRCSDRNWPKERPRPAVLQGGSHQGLAKADDGFTKGIILESSSSGLVIQEESSAALILGSFHLNCCKEQFFHDKQIASVPQQQWGGHCHPLPPQPFLHGALTHPPPKGLATGTRHAVRTAMGTGRAVVGSVLAAAAVPWGALPHRKGNSAPEQPVRL